MSEYQQKIGYDTPVGHPRRAGLGRSALLPSSWRSQPGCDHAVTNLSSACIAIGSAWVSVQFVHGDSYMAIFAM